MPIRTIIVRLATPISSGAVQLRDLGLVSLRDAAIYGKTRPLIPFDDGRLIKSVTFVPSNADVPTGASLVIGTPNTLANSYFDSSTSGGMAFVPDGDLENAKSTVGIIIEGNGITLGGPKGQDQIWDCGPLVAIAAFSGGHNGLPVGTWQPSTAYAIVDLIVVGDNIWQASGSGGVSGSSEPDFDPDATPIADGTVLWNIFFAVPTGEVHAIAEVIEGVSLMPSYPASFEFVSPPQDSIAGEPMADITVLVKDQNGDPYKFGVIEVHLDIMGVGTLNGNNAIDTDPTTGISTLPGLSIAEPGTYIMRAQSIPSLVADPIYSDTFNIT